MKLYAKLDLIQRVRLVDPRTKRVNYSHEYTLYPTRPTEVPDVVALQLLKQDPHLVWDKPFGFKEHVGHSEAVNPSKPKATGLMAIVEEIENIGLDNLKAANFLDYADKLGIVGLHYGTKKPERKAAFIKRMDEIKQQAQND